MIGLSKAISPGAANCSLSQEALCTSIDRACRTEHYGREGVMATDGKIPFISLFLFLSLSLSNSLGEVFICAKAEKELQQIYYRLVQNLQKQTS